MSNAFCSGSKRFFNYVFVKHPEEQNMTYFQHLKHACCYSVQALGCSLAFMVHGIVPCLFEKTGFIMVKRLYNQFDYNEDVKSNQD